MRVKKIACSLLSLAKVGLPDAELAHLDLSRIAGSSVGSHGTSQIAKDILI